MRKVIWVAPGIVRFCDDGDGPPPLASGSDVLVRVTAAGICATDVHLIEGRLRLVEPPAVLGHEIAGSVVECGPAVRHVRPGDRVKCDSVIGCGRCPWCRRGATQFCPSRSELGISRPGGWAEYVVAPERNLYPLPAAVADEVAAVMDVEVPGPCASCGSSRANRLRFSARVRPA
ncbi:MAG: alcohol dehydrogenase catalytic domain-containing protein [Bryobacteraceae bacterium]